MNQPIQFSDHNCGRLTLSNRARLRGELIIALLAFACLGVAPLIQASDLGGVLPNGNTADGTGVLVNLTTGVWNSGFGFQALNHDDSGGSNTATGVEALFNNTMGERNGANGAVALFSNTNGSFNVATCYGALFYNTTGS